MNELIEHLKDNPCRGLISGSDEQGNGIQICWLMSRSSKGRNRQIKISGDIAKVDVLDRHAMYDPSWLYYTSFRLDDIHVSGNWNHINRLYDDFMKSEIPINSEIFYSTLEKFNCAPDYPAFTPRISVFQKNIDVSYFSIIAPDSVKRESALLNNEIPVNINDNSIPSERYNFEMHHENGNGYCITTYMPGSQDLNPFNRQPIAVSLVGKLEDMMDNIWSMLEPEWRISVSGVIFNKDFSRYANPINKK
jgi:hypothetical protein